MIYIIYNIYDLFLKDHTYWYDIFVYICCEIVLLDHGFHGYWKEHHLNHHLFWIFQLMIMDYRQLLMITVDKKLHKTYCTRWYSMCWLFWWSFWHDSILVLECIRYICGEPWRVQEALDVSQRPHEARPKQMGPVPGWLDASTVQWSRCPRCPRCHQVTDSQLEQIQQRGDQQL